MPTYYVDGINGLDTNDGSQLNPFQTLDKAFSILSSGDVVNVEPNTEYSVSSNSLVKNVTFTLQSVNYKLAVIDFGNQDILYDNILCTRTFKKIHIKNIGNWNAGMSSIFVFEDSIFEGYGDGSASAFWTNSTNQTFTGCYLHNFNMVIANGWSVNLVRDTHTTVENCVFRNITGLGAYMGTYDLNLCIVGSTVTVASPSVTSDYIIDDSTEYYVTQNGKVYGATELSNLIKYLFEDGTDIKSYDGSVWSIIGTSPVTESMFTNNGLENLTLIDDAAIQSLLSDAPKLLYWTTDAEVVSKTLNSTKIPLPKLIKSTGDIDLSSIEHIDSFTLTSNVSGAGKLRVITSVDSGTTWKTWDTGSLAWVDIDSDDLVAVEANGMTPAMFNGITAWNELRGTSDTIRFAYYLELDASTDVASTDQLTLQADTKGVWKGLNPSDYDYSFSNTELKISFYANGDYKVNY